MSTALMVQDTGEVPGSTQAEKEATLRYWNSFNLDQYYAEIEEYTFKTEFVEFKKEEGQAFLQWARNPAAQLPPAQAPLLDGLRQRIDDACDLIRKAIPTTTKLFIKLSSRSAKDAVDKRPDFLIPFLKKRLSEMEGSKTEEGLPESLNSQMVALRRAFLDSMAVTSAAEALEQFSYSARIVSDLKRAIDFDQWDLHIVVREYLDLPIDGELRGIVHNGKLNGLSQYYAECFFPELVDRKDQVAQSVKKFFKRAKKQIKHESFIFDVVVFHDMTIKIVELNPFGAHTGAAMFSWDKDAEIIKNGPFEFRVRTEPAPDAHLNAILGTWRHLLDMATKPVTASQPSSGEGKGDKCILS